MSTTPETISAGPAANVPPGERVRIETDDDVIVVYNVDGAYYAISNICPHANGPLNQGFIENGRVSCPWHGWSFQLSPDDPPRDGLPRYRVTIENGELLIHFPAIFGTRSSFE